MEFSRTGEFGSEFLIWLQQVKNLQKRSSNDVLSHLSRASRYVDLYDVKLNFEDMAYLMGKNPNFHKLSPNAKSHLRRSLKLFHEFQEYIDKEKSLRLF